MSKKLQNVKFRNLKKYFEKIFYIFLILTLVLWKLQNIYPIPLVPCRLPSLVETKRTMNTFFICHPVKEIANDIKQVDKTSGEEAQRNYRSL